MELINASTGDKHKVLKYAAPTKAAVGKINLNGAEVETRFTSARGKEYTYFPVSEVSLYVAGALDPEASYTLEAPAEMKGPAWEGTRKSYYVRKRPAKPATEGETNAQSDNSTESGTTGAEDGSGSTGASEQASTDVESTTAEDGVTEAAKPRRRRA